jgi:hypothetical protein
MVARPLPAFAGTSFAGHDNEAPDCMGLFLRFRLHGVIPRNSPRPGAAMATQLSEEQPTCARQPDVSGFAIRLRIRRRGHVRSFLTPCRLVSPFSRAGCALHVKNDGSSTERERAVAGARGAVRRASRGAAKSAARSAGCVASSATMRMRCWPWRARHSARRPRGICSATATFGAGAIPSRPIGACVRWAFRAGGRRAAIRAPLRMVVASSIIPALGGSSSAPAARRRSNRNCMRTA